MQGERRGRLVGGGRDGIGSRGTLRGLGKRRRCRDLLLGCRSHDEDRFLLIGLLEGPEWVTSVFACFVDCVARETSSNLRDE